MGEGDDWNALQCRGGQRSLMGGQTNFYINNCSDLPSFPQGRTTGTLSNEIRPARRSRKFRTTCFRRSTGFEISPAPRYFESKQKLAVDAFAHALDNFIRCALRGCQTVLNQFTENGNMRKGDETRQEIIRKAAPIFNRKGYRGAALSDLMRATGLKKGGSAGSISMPYH